MEASSVTNGNDSWDKDVPLLSPPPLEPTGEEESPEYSPYWSFLTPSRRTTHDSPSNHDHLSFLAVTWNKLIAFCKIPILVIIVFGIWPFGIVSFRRFQDSTDSTFHPIPGSPSAVAQDAFAQNYASNDWMNPMHPSLLLVLSTDTNYSLTSRESPLYAPARDFFLSLPTHLNKTCWNETTTQNADDWLKVTSYYSLQQDDLHWLSKSLATKNGDSVLLSIQYLLDPNATNARSQVHELMNVVQEYGDLYKPDNCTISYTGIKWFQSDLMTATKTDLKRMDALVLPLALLLVGVVLPKARPSVVWIIPLFTIFTTVCCWSIIMSFLSAKIQITQFTPSIMTSLTLGMGIDYTLFLLSRYLEMEEMSHMLQYGGQVLLLSGLTLMCTFLGLVCLPLAMLKSVGIGAAVAIGSCLIVNLTVVPALLHTQLATWIVQPATTDTTTEENFLQRRPDTEISPDGVVPHDSFWYRLSQHLLHPYKSVIIFLLLVQLIIPVALYATQLKSSLSFDLMLPRTSPSLVTYHDLGRKLGYGRTSPYRILFDGHSVDTRMDSEQGFDVMHRVLDELSAIDKDGNGGITHLSTGLQEFEEQKRTLMEALGFTKDNATVLCEPEVQQQTTNYAGIAVLKNVYVPHSLFVAAKYCAQVKPHCPVEILHLVEYVDQMSTSSDRYATFVTATLAVNPFSDEGVKWLESARETIQRLQDGNALGGIQVYIEGSAAIEYDAVEAVYGAFPKVITITMLVVFVLFGTFFKSIVAPLRSVVSIAMTLCFVFGLCVLVYQHGILNWTRVPSWTSTGDEISWLVPVMAFSIIVGLALDYDVFLISRILEYRQDGLDHESSIVAGLYSTGGIITAAGLIMAVAFGGLMFSSSPVLYQWSFLLTSAVLLDTFVIRTLVVPIVLGWTGKFSWWPRRLPPVLVVETANSVDSRLSLGPLSASHCRTSRGNDQLTQALLSP
jgi:predicted RND superfamily exporter protein